MLNLSKLEEKVDKALENETDQSLFTWVINKINEEFYNDLGCGELNELSNQAITYISAQPPSVVIINEEGLYYNICEDTHDDENYEHNSYRLAA